MSEFDQGNRQQLDPATGYRLATDAEAMAGIWAAVEAGEMSVYVSEKEMRADLAAALAELHEAMARAAAIEKAGRVEAGYEAVTSPFEWRIWRTMTHAIAALNRMIELDPGLDDPILAKVKVGGNRTAEFAALDDTERDALLMPAHAAAGKAAEQARVLLDRLTVAWGHTEQEEAVWSDVDDRLDRIAGTLRVNTGELGLPAFRELIRTDWEDEAADRAELAATYNELSAAGRAEALSLGISGHGAAANARRRDLAQRLQVEHSQRNKAYFTGQTAERPVSPPFGLRLIVKHEGDLAAVVADDAINGDLITALGLAEEGRGGANPRPDEMARLAEERARIADQLGLGSRDAAEDNQMADPAMENAAGSADDVAAVYSQLVRVDRAEALKLGIEGSDAEANQRRAELARLLIEENGRRTDSAYTRAAEHRSLSEPWIREPFGLWLVDEHAGDLAAVAADPALDQKLREDMQIGLFRTQFVNDEDGERYVDIEPTDAEHEAVAEELARITSKITGRPAATAHGQASGAEDQARDAAGSDQLVATPYGPDRIVEAFYGLDADASTAAEGYRVRVDANGVEKLIKAEHVSTDRDDVEAAGALARFADGTPMQFVDDAYEAIPQEAVSYDDWDQPYRYRVPQRNDVARQSLAAALFDADTALGRAEQLEDHVREAAGYDDVTSEFALEIDFARGDVQRAMGLQRLIEGTDTAPPAGHQAGADADGDQAAVTEATAAEPVLDAKLGEDGHSLGAHRDADVALGRARFAFTALLGSDDDYAEWDRTDAAPTDVDELGDLIGQAQATTRSNLNDLQTPDFDDRIRADWEEQDQATRGLVPDQTGAADAWSDDAPAWWSESDVDSEAADAAAVTPDFDERPATEPPDPTAEAVQRAQEAVHDLQQRQTEEHRRTAAERARSDDDLARWHQQDQQQHAAIEQTDSGPVLDRADHGDA